MCYSDEPQEESLVVLSDPIVQALRETYRHIERLATSNEAVILANPDALAPAPDVILQTALENVKVLTGSLIERPPILHYAVNGIEVWKEQANAEGKA